ncbi:MAG: hypothetical protein ACRD9L_22865 [Bryobacteraceae bacterium]
MHIFLIGVCLAAPALPPIGGGVHDNQYDVSWLSTARLSGGWTLNYLLHNTRSTHVRIVWKDASGTDIYSGWLDQTATPRLVCMLDIGPAMPDAPWESWIDVGKLPPRKTNVYQPPTTLARRVSSKSLLGVLVKGEIRLLSVAAVSVYEKRTIRYSLSLNRTEWAGMVRFSWPAADSSKLRALLSKRPGGALIRLDSEPLNIEIPADSAPRIRNGALIVWSDDGLRLGSVLAPALAE